MSELEGGAQRITLVLPKLQKPPPWKDLPRCMGCRESFSFFRRHHHCRHCGGDFCYSCCNKETTIPKFGYIVSSVKVCNPCYKIVTSEVESFKNTIRPPEDVKTENRPEPPGWINSQTCMSCRAEFTRTNRDHHCRNCGRNLCEKCCSNFTAIPKYGWFLKQVRVCNPCLSELKESGETSISIVQREEDGTITSGDFISKGSTGGQGAKVKAYKSPVDQARDMFTKKTAAKKAEERREATGLLQQDGDMDESLGNSQSNEQSSGALADRADDLDALVHDHGSAGQDSIATALSEDPGLGAYSIGDDDEDEGAMTLDLDEVDEDEDDIL